LQQLKEIIHGMASGGDRRDASARQSEGEGDDDDWCFGTNKDYLTGDLDGIDSERHDQTPVLHIVSHGTTGTEDVFRNLERPFVRASVVEISVALTLFQPPGMTETIQVKTLSLHTDITSSVAMLDEVFGHFPHLTLCASFWLLPEEEISDPFCIRADALNYHSTIDSHFPVTLQELVIHAWFQVSEEGGKIRDSDCFVPVSLALPNSGLIFSDPKLDPQTSIECLVKEKSTKKTRIFSYTPTYRSSFQHATADFCRGYGLIGSSCYHTAYQLSQCIHDRATHPKLPNIQLSPTPHDPFVFLHFEKVGGTSLRE
jgi:hypothetical protein